MPDVAALAALHEARVAPAIQQQNRLLTALQPLLYRGDQRCRENVDAAAAPLARTHIDDFYGRERPALYADRQLEHAILSRQHVTPALERRCRTPEHADRACLARAYDGNLARMIARGF